MSVSMSILRRLLPYHLSSNEVRQLMTALATTNNTLATLPVSSIQSYRRTTRRHRRRARGITPVLSLTQQINPHLMSTLLQSAIQLGHTSSLVALTNLPVSSSQSGILLRNSASQRRTRRRTTRSMPNRNYQLGTHNPSQRDRRAALHQRIQCLFQMYRTLPVAYQPRTWTTTEQGPFMNALFTVYEELVAALTIKVSEAQKAVINQTTVQYVYEAREDAETDPDLCPICLGQMESGDNARRLRCSHFFHVACIDQWLRLKTVCPMCRIDIFASNEIMPSSLGAI